MTFDPGFRLSKSDMMVIVIALLGAVAGYPYSSVITFVILFVVGHFFIFCNVVRMSRPPELIWAITFILLAGASLVKGYLSLTTVALLCAALTIVLVVLETRKPRYHGIFWQKLNPELPQWFEQQINKHQGPS